MGSFSYMDKCKYCDQEALYEESGQGAWGSARCQACGWEEDWDTIHNEDGGSILGPDGKFLYHIKDNKGRDLIASANILGESLSSGNYTSFKLPLYELEPEEREALTWYRGLGPEERLAILLEAYQGQLINSPGEASLIHWPENGLTGLARLEEIGEGQEPLWFYTQQDGAGRETHKIGPFDSAYEASRWAKENLQPQREDSHE